MEEVKSVCDTISAMPTVKPVAEHEAEGEIAAVYHEIRQILATDTVPRVFLYLAAFPDALRYIWVQSAKNLQSSDFLALAQDIGLFAQTAIDTVYVPSSAVGLFRQKIKGRNEEAQLNSFAESARRINAMLYLLCVSIREGLKGQYLGLRQIGESVTIGEASAVHSLSEEFTPNIATTNQLQHNTPLSPTPSTDTRITAQKSGLATTPYAEFFNILEKEMQELIKKEAYLTRRVELERFALLQLPLFPYPLEASYRELAAHYFDNRAFAELIYMLSEVFPTQTPHRLVSACAMKKALA